MVDRLLRLGKDTAIYGVSSIVGRFLNFLLVPFYTHYLVPAEYGTIATLYSYIAFAFIVYGYGLESAYMRYVASQELAGKKETFTTAFLSLCVSSLVLSLALFLLSESASALIGLGVGGGYLLKYAAWILFFDTLVVIPFASLRMDQRAKKFAALKVFNILVNVAANIFLLAVVRMQAEGVLLANLIASFLTFIVLLKVVAAHFTTRLPSKLYPALLRFGLPLLPSGIASVAMHVIDRPILKALTNEATVGIYQANYRLGIIMMLLVSMFDYAWRPFYLTHYTDPDAKTLFGRIFTYLLAVLATVLLTISLFIEDIIRISVFGVHLIHPAYWSGVVIVPWILLAYVLSGAYTHFVVGVNIKKKTHYLAAVTGAGAIVNVIANYALIPPLGMMGAAYATLVSYGTMVVALYRPSQRLFQIDYEWWKIAVIAIVTASALGIYTIIPVEQGTPAAFLLKSALVAGFIGALLGARVLRWRLAEAMGARFRSSSERSEDSE
jgi:O-antigen/teichoic acid export membrane protein